MRKIISVVLSFGLLFQQSGLLYAAGEINLANYLSQARNAIVQPEVFQPARLRYISYDINNNDFKLLLDKGDNVLPRGAVPEKDELFNYFLTGLALPNDTFWVNLRPDAPENIIDPLLEKTEIGKIFLEADLQLKKDTASLTSPQNPEGKSYWDKLYKKAGELFGTENITIPTITRPWIVPNEVIVRETEDSAYIYKATLKVMLEADYLTGRGGSRTAPTPEQYGFSDPRLKELNEYSSRIIRETIIPKLTKEVNSSKRYAKLRQVYYSLVLARWFKQKYQGLPVGNGLKPFPTLDSGDLTNLTSQEPCDKQTYFQAYQKSFKDGEYNLKETVATPFGQSIRSYISGGIMAGSPIRPGNLNMQVGNTKVTDALTGGFAGSPLEVKQVVKALEEIRSGLNVINKKVSSLSRNGHGNNIQSISVPLGQAINSVRIKINSLQKPKGVWEEEVLSYLPGLEKSLGEINSEAVKLVLPKTGAGVEDSLKSLSKDMKTVLSKVSELYKNLQSSAGSPIGVRLSQDLPDNIRYVKLGDLSESGFEYAKEILNGIFPGLEITANDTFIAKINWSGGIERILWADIGNVMVFVDTSMKSEISEAINKNISIDKKIRQRLTANMIKEDVNESVGSPVVGEELIVSDKDGKAIEYLRFVSYDKDMKGKNRLMLKDIMDRLNTTALLSDSGRPVYQFTLDSSNLSGMYFAVELDDSGKVVELKGILRIVNKKREALGGKNQEVINALKNKEKEIVSSAVVSGEVVKASGKWGGIDLTDRALQIKLERVGSFASTPLLLPQVKNAQSLDLDKEFEQLEALASSGIVPNSHRLLELFTVCHYRGEFGERLTQIISCLKASSAIQEAEAIDSDEDFRLALMMPEVLS